jgi:hypothetical protein
MDDPAMVKMVHGLEKLRKEEARFIFIEDVRV